MNILVFVNYARSFGQVTELPASVMIATQQRMFARRSVQQRLADVDLLNAMYERPAGRDSFQWIGLSCEPVQILWNWGELWQESGRKRLLAVGRGKNGKPKW